MKHSLLSFAVASVVNPMMENFKASLSKPVAPKPTVQAFGLNMTKEQMLFTAKEKGIKVQKSWTKAKLIEVMNAAMCTLAASAA